MIYLIQEKKFIDSKENIYTIGICNQENIKKLNLEENNLLLNIQCADCKKLKNTIIKKFKTKYLHRTDIDNKYFDGNYIEMIQDIFYLTVEKNKEKNNYKEPDNINISQLELKNIKNMNVIELFNTFIRIQNIKVTIEEFIHYLKNYILVNNYKNIDITDILEIIKFNKLKKNDEFR